MRSRTLRGMMRPLLRSKLFVPGSRPELFDKALAGAADALSFDLEDAVPAAAKAEARARVAAFVGAVRTRDARKLVIVRVNALATPNFAADLAAVAVPGVDLINLPKCESADDVVAAAQALERLDCAAGIRLLVNIETPRALRQAAQIATAHPLVAGLQLGLGDLFEPFGIDRRDQANVHAAMFALRMAAAEADVFCCDSAFAAIEDEAGFCAEAQLARRLGFVGKTCIHPRQVPLANAAFRLDDEEIAAAQRIVAAARTAAARGLNAFALDGRMIDPPYLRRAEAIVAAAQGQN